jgi:hypothetical protein
MSHPLRGPFKNRCWWFFVVFLSQPSPLAPGVFFLIFAAVCYAAAELAVSQAQLYRYGIEEALAVLLGCFSLRGSAVRSFQRQPLFAKARRSPVPGSRGRRRLFALDMAPLRALLCIPRRDDLRPLSARLLDVVALSAASDRRRVLCDWASRCSNSTLPPPL